MAQTRATRTAAATGGSEPKTPTQRMVLRGERVIVLPESVTDAMVTEALKTLKGKASVEDAWVPVGVHVGDTKDQAIEAHAGRPGTPDAAPGVYKAPTVKAWAGGLRLVAPPRPLIEKETID